eukprot:15364747-Ditylum_brightwellii.AAC.1
MNVVVMAVEWAGLYNNHSSRVKPVKSRDGLVGYDAALTQLRSRVQFPVFVYWYSPHIHILRTHSCKTFSRIWDQSKITVYVRTTLPYVRSLRTYDNSTFVVTVYRYVRTYGEGHTFDVSRCRH